MKPLPTNPLRTLADEILAVLPSIMIENPHGPRLRIIAQRLGADEASVRRAARQLNVDARADLMRRLDSPEQFLVPIRYRKAVGLRYCANCGETFTAPPVKTFKTGTHYSDRRCCSRSCGIAWSWTRPGVKQRRIEAIKTERKSPEAMARLAAHNKRRWSRPEEHEKLSAQNRREWADPVKGALRAQSIKAVNGSPKMVKFYSDLRKAWWKDPAMRQKMLNAAKASQSTQEYRAKLSKLVRERWRDPVWRKKWTEANRIKSRKGVLAQAEKRRVRNLERGVVA